MRHKILMAVLALVLPIATVIATQGPAAGKPKGKIHATGSFSCTGTGGVVFSPPLRATTSGPIDHWKFALKQLRCTAVASNVTPGGFTGQLSGHLRAYSDNCFSLAGANVLVTGTLTYTWTAMVGASHVAPTTLSMASISLQNGSGNQPVSLTWSGSTSGSFAGNAATGTLVTAGIDATESDLLTTCQSGYVGPPGPAQPPGIYHIGVDATSVQG